MMISTDNLISYMRQASELYSRLIVLIISTQQNKADELYQLAATYNANVMNVNLELASSMLEMTHRQRKLRLSDVFESALTKYIASLEGLGDFALLDYIDILFEPSLQTNPLALLQRVSRKRVIVAAWRGTLEDGMLIYGQPNHPAYRRYQAKDFFTVALD